MKKSLAVLTLSLTASLTQAATYQDSTATVNELNALVANAELVLSVSNANDVLRDVQTQQALGALTASVASAELTLAMVDASDTIHDIPDSVMLAELDQSLQANPEQSSDMIMSVISERPMLAAAVETLSMDAGVDSNLIAAAIASGLSSAQATAAGQ